MQDFTSLSHYLSQGSSNSLRSATLLKKRLWYRCFHVNFVKFLRRLFSQDEYFPSFDSEYLKSFRFFNFHNMGNLNFNWILIKNIQVKVIIVIAQKMKFSIKDFFSKSDQIPRKLRIWSHLLKKSLMENLLFVQWVSLEILALPLRFDLSHKILLPLKYFPRSFPEYSHLPTNHQHTKISSTIPLHTCSSHAISLFEIWRAIIPIIYLIT